MDILSQSIYYIPPPPSRPRKEPMRVLCLGLMRTGTDSLRAALESIDIPTSHGYSYSASGPHSAALIRFVQRRDRGELATLTQPELQAECDVFLSQYSAVTDIHNAAIAHELLRAYPDAKVVINTRDYGPWKASVDNIMATYWASNLHFWRWFNAEVWYSHLAGAHLFTNFFRHSFPIFSHQVFHEHYGGLKELLTRQNRPYLEWRVEDGWRPLCEFLDVDVPDREFPSGNTPKDFAEKFAERHGGRMRKARRNLLICAGVVATVGIWGAAQRGPGWGSSALGHWVGGIRQWIQVSL